MSRAAVVDRSANLELETRRIVEAAGFIQDAPLETQDFDMAWSSTEAPADRRSSGTC